MPAYNEQANIETVIWQWYSVVERINAQQDCSARLVIADDGSKDNTMEIMNSLVSELPFFIPLRKTNSGHGATVLYLYRYAIEHGADYVFQTDSDGQTNPDEFWQLFILRHEYDMQIGHRCRREDGKDRVVVAKVLQLLILLIFHVWVVDANTPFRLMASDKLNKVMAAIPSDFFLCNIAITAIATKWNYNVRFIPITFRPRQGGVNSINLIKIFKIGSKALVDLFLINYNLNRETQVE